MTRPRLLDLFCGAGGAGMGYCRAGFDVVGVDIAPQPDYPFEFHQADAMTFPLDGFDVIHASPPCQAFTTLRVMHNARSHADLLTPVREHLREWGGLYVIENVPGSPMQGAIQLCGTSFNLGLNVYDGWRELRRHRWFESNTFLFGAPCKHEGATVGIYGDHARDRRRKPGVHACIDFPDVDRINIGRTAMGMPWVTVWRGLSQAIPPAYTEYIGAQLLQALIFDTTAAS